MINSEFSIVSKVYIDNDFVNFHADENERFNVIFNGNRVHFIKGKYPRDVYGKILICWTEQVNCFFMVLKNNMIYNIKDDNKKLIQYIASHPTLFREFTNMGDVISFSLL